MPSQVAVENSTCRALISSWLPRPPSGGGGKFHLPRANLLLAAVATFGWRRKIPPAGGGRIDRGSAGLLTDRRAGKADPDTRPPVHGALSGMFGHSVHEVLSGMFGHSSASHLSF